MTRQLRVVVRAAGPNTAVRAAVLGPGRQNVATYSFIAVRAEKAVWYRTATGYTTTDTYSAMTYPPYGIS